jgi:ATP-dependent Clp protease ATP-binding subunit ClpA
VITKIDFSTLTPQEWVKVNSTLCTCASLLLTINLVNQFTYRYFKGVGLWMKTVIHFVSLVLINERSIKWPELTVSLMALATFAITQPWRSEVLNKCPPFLTDMADMVSDNDMLIIGNEERIEQLENRLRNIRNPNCVLVGKSGIGKTSVLKGVVALMKAGKLKDQSPLKGKRIFELDHNSFMSNTGLVGDLSTKIYSLIQFTKNNPDVYIFIDEFYITFYEGKYHDNPTAFADYLKSPLTNNEIRIIGCSTDEEFKMIEKNIAYQRRFEKITIQEPSAESCVKILKHRMVLAPFTDSYPSVAFTDDGLQSIVNSSFSMERKLGQPDRSITLMESVAGYFNKKLIDENDVDTYLRNIANQKK